MKTGGKYTNAIENRLMIDRFTLDMYGDELMIMGFRFTPIHSPMMIIKVSDKYETKLFQGHFSVN